jgi:hypothetical protein
MLAFLCGFRAFCGLVAVLNPRICHVGRTSATGRRPRAVTTYTPRLLGMPRHQRALIRAGSSRCADVCVWRRRAPSRPGSLRW